MSLFEETLSFQILSVLADLEKLFYELSNFQGSDGMK